MVEQVEWAIHGGRRRRFLEAWGPPAGLDAKLALARPELSPSARAEAVEGLRDWLRICQLSKLRWFVAMPSRAVDDAWHELILFTRSYVDLCRGAFGRYLHHAPAEGPDEPDMVEGLRAAWWYACQLEGIDPEAPERLPRIFDLDRRLGLEDGVRYDLVAVAPGDPRAVPVAPRGRRPGGGTGPRAAWGCGGMGCGAGCGGGGCGGGGCGGGG